jgi:acyl-coenzyme A synthetase/AMP-(fatty) acid ligase
MVRPGIDFFTLTFALFKTGAVPVVVDPGMGLERMLRCLASTRPEAFIGIPAAHLLRVLRPGRFGTVRSAVTVGWRGPWGGTTLARLLQRTWTPYTLAPTERHDTAAILFTTGSTGPARGAVYTHGVFEAQIHTIQRHFAIGDGEIDLPTFPLFALFDPALGMTAVIPRMDPTRPARANPELLVEAIVNQGVTNLFASPALVRLLGGYGRRRGLRLPSLRRVVSAGAPVAPELIAHFLPLLAEGAELHTPYGATEAVPIASIGSREILSDTRRFSDQGFGLCVGRPLEGLEIRIIPISDGPVAVWTDALTVPEGEIGEIVVRGDLVTRGYFAHPEADGLSKIAEGDRFWHRMGDLGWIDKKGRLWFCGRKNQRVITARGTLYTIPCEAVFNRHPAVLRSALVGLDAPPLQRAAVCIELRPEERRIERRKLTAELRALAAAHDMTREIDLFLVHPAFPVDIRHNAKIGREKLAQWAASRLRRTPDRGTGDAQGPPPPTPTEAPHGR